MGVDGGEGGMDGGGVGSMRALPRSGTTRVFSRGPAGESSAEGDARECFAPLRSSCFGVSGSAVARGVGGGGGGGGVGGRGRGGGCGGGSCRVASESAACFQKWNMDLMRKARTCSMSAACFAARARDLVTRADGVVAVSSTFEG